MAYLPQAIGRHIASKSCVLGHVGELYLKGGNRNMFLGTLKTNIEQAVKAWKPSKVTLQSSRLVIFGNKEDNSRSLESMAHRLQDIPGLANVGVSKAIPLDWKTTGSIDADWDRLEDAIRVIADDIPPNGTFRISARRAFGENSFPMTSLEMNIELGGVVLDSRCDTSVQLTAPDKNIIVEVVQNVAYVHAALENGMGGLPVGTSGRVLALLSGGFDSPVAAQWMMRRGCRVSFLHFHSCPYLPGDGLEKAKDLALMLSKFQNKSRFWISPLGEIQRAIKLATPPEPRVVLYRRMMMRIAEKIARKDQCLGLVTGDATGQVASQTIVNMARSTELCIISTESMAIVGEVVSKEIPLLRPLVGMDKTTIIEEARRIGTHDISVEPDHDTCSLFVPKHPATAAQQIDIERWETKIDIDGLVEYALDNTTVEKMDWEGSIFANYI